MDRPEIVAKYKRKGFVSIADEIRAEGEATGLVKGKLVALVQSAKNFLAMGLSLEQVSQGTGLSVEEIRRNCL